MWHRAPFPLPAFPFRWLLGLLFAGLPRRLIPPGLADLAAGGSDDRLS